MTGDSADESRSRAALVSTLLAIDPASLGGVVLRGRPEPQRAGWIDRTSRAIGATAPRRRIPAGVTLDRLLGGIDIAASLADGLPVFAEGLLAGADGGLVELAMAERADTATIASLCTALDCGELHVERDGFTRCQRARFAVAALDEGIDDEAIDSLLAERLAFRLDVSELGDNAVPAVDIALCSARERLSQVSADAEITTAIARTAQALGIDSLRADLFSLRAARALAALDGRGSVSADDAALACSLVFAHRATRLPTPAENDESPAPTPQEPGQHEESRDDDASRRAETEGKGPDEVVLDAVRAVLPPGLLDAGNDAAAPRDAGNGGRGRAGALGKRRNGGRRTGSLPANRLRGSRIDLLATLRAAIPWQRIRAAGATRKRAIYLEASDLQACRFKDRQESTTVFVVDASGSQAAQRLREVKGAIELLLAESYVRRDQVALIVFRGAEAVLRLPPTRALARARRTLAGVPAGGGTPLAAGIDKAVDLVHAIRRDHRSARIVLLTDGRANVARDGSPGHEEAQRQASDAARRLRATGVRAILVDSSRRPRTAARSLATDMCASYIPLPQADARSLNAAVRRTGPG